VQPDDEGKVRAPRLRLLSDEGRPRAADPRRHQHCVPQARHREQLAYALQEPDDNSLGEVHVVNAVAHTFPMLPVFARPRSLARCSIGLGRPVKVGRRPTWLSADKAWHNAPARNAASTR
jgi:hypothetical protein